MGAGGPLKRKELWGWASISNLLASPVTVGMLSSAYGMQLRPERIASGQRSRTKCGQPRVSKFGAGLVRFASRTVRLPVAGRRR